MTKKWLTMGISQSPSGVSRTFNEGMSGYLRRINDWSGWTKKLDREHERLSNALYEETNDDLYSQITAYDIIAKRESRKARLKTKRVTKKRQTSGVYSSSLSSKKVSPKTVRKGR